MRYIWNSFGLFAVGLGVLGIILPLVPAVPFLLLAAYCFSNGSERLHQWLLTHKWLGAPIRNWKKNRSLSPRVKCIAIISIAVCFGISLAIGLPQRVLIIQAIVLSAVSLFIWTRPSK